MNLRGVVYSCVRWLALAASGALVFETTGCTVEDLLSSYGLSQIISALFGSTTA